MQGIILISSLLVVLISCNQKSEQKEIASTFSKNIRIDSIELEQVPLPEFETSFIGEFEIYDGFIHFIDKEFGKIYQFSSEGELLNQFLAEKVFETKDEKIPVDDDYLFVYDLKWENSIK